MKVNETAATMASGPEGPEQDRFRIRVFGTQFCGWCQRAENLLRQHGIRFDSIDVTGDAQARARLVEEAGGRRTVPVIFLGNQAIGGYEELARLMRVGGLDHLKPSGVRPAGK